nr:MerR family transcriptional regulator [Myxococcus sp. RHSTA-1-4]
MRIGELARRAGLTVRTLHHYDAIGLLRPSARSGGGYRLYGQADITRLHAIQSLRHLGLSLEDIGRLLAQGGATLPAILEQQIRALDRQIEQAMQLRTRLGLIQAQVSGGHEPEPGDWLATLRLMTTCDKYFSTEELKKILGNWRVAAADMVPLMADVRRAMERGVPADSLEVQPLAYRWMTLVGTWMEGDFDLIRRWGDMYRREHSAMSNKGPDPRMVAYIDRAIEIRLAALGRHLSLDELKRLTRIPREEWQRLSQKAGQLMRQDVPPRDKRARALAREWMGLMDRLANHEPELRDKLLAAYRDDPVLAAASVLEAPVRQYLQRAAESRA